jgi:hypothetical protein
MNCLSYSLQLAFTISPEFFAPLFRLPASLFPFYLLPFTLYPVPFLFINFELTTLSYQLLLQLYKPYKLNELYEPC